MSFGFNTDIRVGEHVFHVQTEDRGQSPRVIESVVYRNGQVLHRRTERFDLVVETAQLSDDALRQCVEDQHRAVIEDMRSGTLDSDIASADRAAGIQVQLLNPKSWLSQGRVLLDVEIVRRADRQPEAGAQVEALIEGSGPGSRHAGISDGQGRVRIEFPLPPLGKGDLALVILARANSGTDELRFAMRARPKAPPGDGSPR